LPTDRPYSLDFAPLDEGRYPCFGLALNAAKQGGTYPTVLSAADEVAVGAFLAGKIGFTDIYRVVERVLARHDSTPGEKVSELLAADAWATRQATEIVEG
jgi:1-deoxy-D-xylulose-5-phosphate reductoisomerase